jgi:hypothetical protein
MLLLRLVLHNAMYLQMKNIPRITFLVGAVISEYQIYKLTL